MFAAGRERRQTVKEADESIENEQQRRRLTVSLPRDVRGILAGFDSEGRAMLVDRDQPGAIRYGVVIQHTVGRPTWAPSSDRPLTFQGHEVLQVAPPEPPAGEREKAEAERAVLAAIEAMSPGEAAALARAKGLVVEEEGGGPDPAGGMIGDQPAGEPAAASKGKRQRVARA